jgi:hypothetical protein
MQDPGLDRAKAGAAEEWQGAGHLPDQEENVSAPPAGQQQLIRQALPVIR